MFQSDYFQTMTSLAERYDLTYHDGFLDDLISRYKEPHRHYHNERHISTTLMWAKVLIELGKLPLSDEELELVRIAILYHDAVYVPGFPHNELLSADMAESHLMAMGIRDPAPIHTIRRLILATRNHEPEDDLEAIICGADLFELGTDRYQLNSIFVHQEYGSPAPELWAAGRRQFIETYLAKPTLFWIANCDELEVKARQNMQNELRGFGGCKFDTDDDGDCGKRMCPFCSDPSNR